MGLGGANKNIDFLDSSWNVWHLKCLPIKLPTPGGVEWGYFFVITFLGSSWHFPDFWFFDPLNSHCDPLWGGGNIFYRFSRQFMKFTGLLKCWPPTHPPPGTPRGGMGKNKFIDFLDSSWHFPDFWFFDPLKFPLRPPPLGWGGQFF